MAKARMTAQAAPFDAGEVGAASAEVLRRFQSLVGGPIKGRFFKTISTLSDMSQQAADEFEAAAQATLQNEIAKANAHVIRGTMAANRARSASRWDDTAIPLPEYLRWKR